MPKGVSDLGELLAMLDLVGVKGRQHKAAELDNFHSGNHDLLQRQTTWSMGLPCGDVGEGFTRFDGASDTGCQERGPSRPVRIRCGVN